MAVGEDHSEESWTLQVGSRQYSFAEATQRSGGEVQWCLDSVDVPDWEDGDEIAVKIFSSAPALSTDATLSELALSPGTLTPTFDPETTQYTATVENTVERVPGTLLLAFAARLEPGVLAERRRPTARSRCRTRRATAQPRSRARR